MKVLDVFGWGFYQFNAVDSTENEAQKLNSMNSEKFSVENKIDLSRCSCVHNLHTHLHIENMRLTL